MSVYENLLPGRENALSPDYLAVKCNLSSVRLLQKEIEMKIQIWMRLPQRIPMQPVQKRRIFRPFWKAMT